MLDPYQLTLHTITLRQFVAAHANLHAVPLTREAERIHKLAEQAGIKTTDGSVKNAIYVMRTEAGLPPLRPPVTKKPKAAKAAKVNLPKPERKAADLDDDDKVILTMLDDMAAAIALVKQALSPFITAVPWSTCLSPELTM